jgi:hypothetical protein
MRAQSLDKFDAVDLWHGQIRDDGVNFRLRFDV